MIYMDYAATTPLAEEVLEEMLPFLKNEYANPASVYGFAGTARKAVDTARAHLAEALGASKEEIFFTGGGTESDNWAIKSIAEHLRDKGRRMITTAIEHPAVRESMEYLKKQGYDITYLPVDKTGRVNPLELKRALRPDTILISVMAANNETGVLQPLKEIGQIAKENGVLFHTDAVQAFGHIPLPVKEYGIDLLSASAHKINGPKGVGLLYVNKELQLPAFMHGGAQERNRRSGTLNVPGIVGFGKAICLSMTDREQKNAYIRELRDYLVKRVLTEIPDAKLWGEEAALLPGHANLGFGGCEGEALLFLLDREKICVSSGSACSSANPGPSRVLAAMGAKAEEQKGSIRFSLSEQNTKEEVDFAVAHLTGAVAKLRAMNSQYQKRVCE